MFRLAAMCCALWGGVLAVAAAHAQQSGTAAASPPALGAHFTPVPEILYNHLPVLPRGQGLAVDRVADKSIAQKIGLRKHDIVLRLDTTAVRDPKHLSDLLATSTPGTPHTLHILRNGRPTSLSYTLSKDEIATAPTSATKNGEPPAVLLQAEPMTKGKLRVTLTYYAGSSKQQSITCTGSVAEIEAEVRELSRRQQIPHGIQDLVEVALQRVRALNAQPRP